MLFVFYVLAFESDTDTYIVFIDYIYTDIQIIYVYIHICILEFDNVCLQLVYSSEQGSSLRTRHILRGKSMASGWSSSTWWILVKHFMMARTSPHVSFTHLETMLQRVKYFLVLRLWINLILFKEFCVYNICYIICKRNTFKDFF